MKCLNIFKHKNNTFSTYYLYILFKYFIFFEYSNKTNNLFILLHKYIDSYNYILQYITINIKQFISLNMH